MKYIFTVLVLFGLYSYSLAQTFGFGCLGFVGAFGGYSYQLYKPSGLNEYIREFNETRKDNLSNPMKEFSDLKGFRVGLNFFRADIKGLILTTKGFYQSVVEKNQADYITDAGSSNSVYELKLRNWGVGIDLGTSITKSFNWKVIDAVFLFNTVTFTDTRNSPNAVTEIKNYKNKSIVGYTVGTGFILDIVDDYITLEGTAGYTFINVDNLTRDDGSQLTKTENTADLMKNFIEKGGLNAVLQLNVGFPL